MQQHSNEEARRDIATETALESLRDEGRRVTTARRLVIEILGRTTDHLTAEGITARVQCAHPEIHMSTVYRTLDSLQAWGLVEQFQQPRGPAFFHLKRGHRHLVCEECGLIRDVPSYEFDAFVAQLRSGYGFELKVGRMALLGRCEEHDLPG
jgi:Fe2+ or Zn2+ uptake regulation protein